MTDLTNAATHQQEESSHFTRVVSVKDDSSVVSIGQKVDGTEAVYATGLIGSIGSLVAFFDSATGL